jgi:hypothetical protein
MLFGQIHTSADSLTLDYQGCQPNLTKIPEKLQILGFKKMFFSRKSPKIPPKMHFLDRVYALLPLLCCKVPVFLNQYR